MALFSILIDIATRTASMEAGFARAEHRINEFSTHARESIKKAFEFAGIGLTVAAFTEGITKSLEYADAVSKAAQKSGASVQAFSELAYAAKTQNIEMQSLSQAIRTMQVNISKGSDVFAAIGVDLKELRKLAPEQQFILIAEAISRLPDPAARARANLEAFGKASGDLAPLFTDGAAGIQKLIQESRDLGKSLDDVSAKSLTEAKESIDRMKTSVDSLWQSLAIKLGPTITNVADAIRTLTGGAKEIEVLETKLKFLQDERNSSIPVLLNFGYDDGSGIVMGPGALDKRIAEIKARIEELTNIKQPSIVGAEGLKPAPGFHAHDDDEVARKINKYDSLWLDYAKSIQYVEDIEQNRFEAEKYHADARESFIAKMDIAAQKEGETLQRSKDSIDEASDRFAEGIKGFDQLSVFAEQAARNIQTYFADFLFDPFKDGLRGMAIGFLDTIRRMLAEAAAAKIFETLFGKPSSSGSSSTGAGGLTGFIGSFLGSFFGGPKAGGGPLDSGKWYVAGERGPEPIWGGGPGAFASGYGGGGNMTFAPTYSIDARGATTDAIALLPRAMKQAHDAAVATIVDMKRRGRF